MKILFHTDTTINGDEKLQQYYTALIAEELKRYQTDLTRVEVHLSDENGNKEGFKDIRCVLEARLEGLHPITVTCQDDNLAQAVSGAIDNLKASLETVLGRIREHRK